MSYMWDRCEFGGDRDHTTCGWVVSASKIHVYLEPKNATIFVDGIFADVIG